MSCDITGWVWASLHFKPTNVTTPGHSMSVGPWGAASSLSLTSPNPILLLAVLIGSKVFMWFSEVGKKRISLPVF